MPVIITCPKCTYKLTVNQVVEGMSVKCMGCNASIVLKVTKPQVPPPQAPRPPMGQPGRPQTSPMNQVVPLPPEPQQQVQYPQYQAPPPPQPVQPQYAAPPQAQGQAPVPAQAPMAPPPGAPPGPRRPGRMGGGRFQSRYGGKGGSRPGGRRFGRPGPGGEGADMMQPKKKKWLVWVIILLLLGGGGAAAYFFVIKKNTSKTGEGKDLDKKRKEVGDDEEPVPPGKKKPDVKKDTPKTTDDKKDKPPDTSGEKKPETPPEKPPDGEKPPTESGGGSDDVYKILDPTARFQVPEDLLQDISGKLRGSAKKGGDPAIRAEILGNMDKYFEAVVDRAMGNVKEEIEEGSAILDEYLKDKVEKAIDKAKLNSPSERARMYLMIARYWRKNKGEVLGGGPSAAQSSDRLHNMWTNPDNRDKVIEELKSQLKSYAGGLIQDIGGKAGVSEDDYDLQRAKNAHEMLQRATGKTEIRSPTFANKDTIKKQWEDAVPK